ncbi:hypothetical protein [Helicobacter rodentium]|nr:hypothetical protein [Helicobacter rodentium]
MHYYRLPRFHKWNLAMTERQNAITKSKPPRHCEALAEAIHNTESRL